MSWNPLRAHRERALRRLVAAFLDQPDARHFGWEISRTAGIGPGYMYPLLIRMCAHGWLTDGWEDPPPTDRPRRRWYQVTELGKRELAALLRTEGES